MQEINEQHIINFYNHFSSRQVIAGQNERHINIFNYLVKVGLKKNHQILEIGCGIGTLTRLMSNFIKNKGSICALDISSENINIAKIKYFNKKNIEWYCSNITSFELEKKFDVIVLPDVLEHIPFNQYEILFKKIKSFLNISGFILIHTPSPFYTKWIDINHKEQLQIIDQSVHVENIINHIIKNEFYIFYLKYYKIWHIQEDYQVIILKNSPDIEKITFHEIIKKITLKNKLIYKMKLFLRSRRT